MKTVRAAFALACFGVMGAIGAQSAIAQKIGSSLIGKLEGPTFVLDANQYPKSFKEAPQLAELVKAGKLPSVDKRLPEPSQMLVIKPLNDFGY